MTVLCCASVSLARVEYIRHSQGYYEAKLTFRVEAPVEQWSSRFQFESSIQNFTVRTPNTQVFNSSNGITYNFGSVGYFPIAAGEWAIEFSVSYEDTGSMPQLQYATFNGKDLDTSYVPPPTTTMRPTKPPPSGGDYHYDEVIAISLEFYEAQRSGKLPSNNRIWWRGDSFLDDGQLNGVDLSGGYTDAADLVKFGFALVSTTTVLNWGLVDFLQGYNSANQTGYAEDAVKWALDFLIKAHPTSHEFYGQVADADIDHAWWGRPEDWDQGLRQSWKITRDKPGSELAAEGAAAFASGYLVFKNRNSSYAQQLLRHAKELYEFADEYRGTYTDAIPAGGFYDSWSGYGDELGWAASWLYRATNESKYLQDVNRHWAEFNLSRRADKFSWDDKKAGLQVLMYKLTKEEKYLTPATQFCDYMKNSQQRTPKGLVFIQEWGSLRHAANIAFICLNLAELGVKSAEYREFAKEQIHYALGDGGRSYVVGYGENPPQRPRHRASSCPHRPSPCNRQNGLYNPGPNYFTLYGALVGGPGLQDDYVDDRDDYVKNEVAIDYNAGFQGALAALQKLKINEQLP
ncbi:Endoglucanase E-4 [Orchesella cincta]|uniref:Endoglucanase n=1 Tax=Orchesella cincta TaxID=48709 RepID=A0A1D2MRW2_ORCCI|nr:Endoglucanase E-4 [Orchesella cincta]